MLLQPSGISTYTYLLMNAETRLLTAISATSCCYCCGHVYTFVPMPQKKRRKKKKENLHAICAALTGVGDAIVVLCCFIVAFAVVITATTVAAAEPSVVVLMLIVLLLFVFKCLLFCRPHAALLQQQLQRSVHG
uniref:Uncharacterized protein n=1 Tax=Ceratitis capitata TaxID=7213 RepID=W8BX58_CERCA